MSKNSLSGSKIQYVDRWYENYHLYDDKGNRYFMSPGEMSELIFQILKKTTFVIQKKRTRTWLTIKKVNKKK